MYFNKTIAVVIPAYNEETSIGLVVRALKSLRNTEGAPLIDDIVVCDNASTDDTPIQAAQSGARLVYQQQRGYGAACLAAIGALAKPDMVVFVDGDSSCLPQEIFQLLEPLAAGTADLVVGSRVLGKQQRGALTPQQKIGNVLASGLIRWLWKYPVTDLGPFRAICFSTLRELQMQDQAFGWTVEMQVKAIQLGKTVVEVPVTSTRRIGQSKISGTLKGTINAARGIFGTIFRLWWQENTLVTRQSK